MFEDDPWPRPTHHHAGNVGLGKVHSQLKLGSPLIRLLFVNASSLNVLIGPTEVGNFCSVIGPSSVNNMAGY